MLILYHLFPQFYIALGLFPIKPSIFSRQVQDQIVNGGFSWLLNQRHPPSLRESLMVGYERAMKPKTPRKSTFTPVVMYPLTPWPVEYIGSVGQVYLHLLLSDKLTLLQSEGADYAHHGGLSPLSLKVFRRACSQHDVKPYTAPKVLYPRYVRKQRQKSPPPSFSLSTL